MRSVRKSLITNGKLHHQDGAQRFVEDMDLVHLCKRSDVEIAIFGEFLYSNNSLVIQPGV